MRILLVEPDQVLARTYSSAMPDYEIISTHDAASAIAALDSGSFDAIILELQLGKHNGVELLYELRSYSDLQTVPVIVHTFVSQYALVMSADVLNGLGVVKFMYKPVTSLTALQKGVGELFSTAAT